MQPSCLSLVEPNLPQRRRVLLCFTQKQCCSPPPQQYMHCMHSSSSRESIICVYDDAFFVVIPLRRYVEQTKRECKCKGEMHTNNNGKSCKNLNYNPQNQFLHTHAHNWVSFRFMTIPGSINLCGAMRRKGPRSTSRRKGRLWDPQVCCENNHHCS